MKTKKLLAGLLSAAMIFSSMTLPAFADDNYVAQVGNDEYGTLAEAFEKAKTGNTVKLLKNVTLTDNIDLKGKKSITLDLGGNTLTHEGDDKSSAADGIIYLENTNLDVKNGVINVKLHKNGNTKGSQASVEAKTGSTLTVTDIELKGNSNNGIFMASDGGKIVINNGIYDVTEGGVVVFAFGEGTEVEINDGTFTGTNSGEGAVYAFNSANVTVNGGNFNFSDDVTDYTKYGVEEGTAVNWLFCDYSGWDGYKYDGVAVTSKANILVKGGTYNQDVSSLCNLKYNSGNNNYSAEKVNYLADGYEMKNRTDENGEIKYIVNPAAEIDGVYYGSVAEAIDAAQGGQTVKLCRNVTEPDAKGSAIKHNLSGKTLDLNNFTYSSNNYSHVFYGKDCTIKNGKAVSLGGGYDDEIGYGSYALFIGVESKDDAFVTENFTVDNVECTGGINVYHKATGVKLKNLTVCGTRYYAVWAGWDTDVTVESGKYSSSSIDGGAVLDAGSDEQRDKGSAVLTVAGGTFICGEKQKIMGSAKTEGELIVTGGTFNTDVSAYLADGKMLKDNGDGTYTVEDINEKLENKNVTTEEKVDTINSVVISKENAAAADKVVEAIKGLPTEAKEQVAPEKVAEIIEAKKAAATVGADDDVVTTSEAKVEAAAEDETSISATLDVTALKSDEFDTLNVKAKTSENREIKLPAGTKAAYFDVTLTKTTAVEGGFSTENVSEVNTPILLKFAVDDASKVAGVIRYHDSKQEYIDYTVADNKTILISAVKFSEYAVAQKAEPTTNNAVLTFEDDNDGDGICNIYLAGYADATVTNFESGEFTITDTVTSGKVGITLTGAEGLTIDEVSEGYYKIHRTKAAADTNAYCEVDTINHRILLGTIALSGTGKGQIYAENIKMYRKSTDDENLAVEIPTTSDVLQYNIKAETAKLTVNVSFPNNIENQKTAYQDMKVTISGGDLTEDIAYSLGSDASENVSYADNTYTLTVTDTLTQNVAYTVTVSGAGYRTARYTVNMTDAKELNFWNNVKDEAINVEEGVGTAKNTTFLAGDIVKDNQINIYDLSAVVSYFGTDNLVSKHEDYAKYDLNRDGKIDSRDIAYVLVSWGK